ncbi:MAG: hypothetical protein ABSA39_23485 [Edaphobacter sp.]
MSDDGLCLESKQSLDRIGASSIRGELKAVAEFEQGENVRNRKAISNPKASGDRVLNPAERASGF